MQMIIPLVGSVFGSGAVGTATAASWIGTAASVLSVGAGLAQISYQNKVAANAAATAAENRDRSLREGQEAQRDQDIEAQAQIAAVTTQQAASGFSLSSPTFQRIQNRNRVLARRDASRIRQSSVDSAENFETQRTDALNSKQGMLLPVLTGITKIGGSLIGGADLVHKARISSFDNNTRTIGVNV